jgi:hypothetical protein
MTDGPDDQETRQRELSTGLVASKLREVRSADEKLSLDAAKLIDARTAGVTGRESRNMVREGEGTTPKDQAGGRSAHQLGRGQRREVGRRRHCVLGRQHARRHLARRLRRGARHEHSSPSSRR